MAHIPYIDVEGNQKEFFIDNYLQRTLDLAKSRVKDKNWDYVCIISGLPGCLTGDTIIKTKQGNRTLSSLNNKTIKVESYNFEEDNKEFNRAQIFSSGKKEVFEIITDDGRIVKATPYHTFFVKRDGKVMELPLLELKEGDELICCNQK